MGLCSAILELWRAEYRKHAAVKGGPHGLWDRRGGGDVRGICLLHAQLQSVRNGCVKAFDSLARCQHAVCSSVVLHPTPALCSVGFDLCLLHKYDEEEDLQAAQDIKPFCSQITHVVSYTTALASVSSCCWMLTRLPPRLWLA